MTLRKLTRDAASSEGRAARPPHIVSNSLRFEGDLPWGGRCLADDGPKRKASAAAEEPAHGVHAPTQTYSPSARTGRRSEGSGGVGAMVGHACCDAWPRSSMRTSREACSGWNAVELSFLGATLQVSTHAPSTCTDIRDAVGGVRRGANPARRASTPARAALVKYGHPCPPRPSSSAAAEPRAALKEAPAVTMAPSPATSRRAPPPGPDAAERLDGGSRSPHLLTTCLRAAARRGRRSGNPGRAVPRRSAVLATGDDLGPPAPDVASCNNFPRQSGSDRRRPCARVMNASRGRTGRTAANSTASTGYT